MNPIVDRLKKEYAGKVDIRIVDVTESNNQNLVNSFRIQYVPTFAFVSKEGRVQEVYIGGISENDLRKKIENLMKK